MLTPTLSVWQVIPWLFVYGVGVGFATAQLTGVILTDVPVHASGQGSGIVSTFRQVGSALGIAILVTTLGSHVSSRPRAVPGLPPAEQKAIASAVRASGGSAIVRLRSQPGSGRIVAASADVLSSSAAAVAFAAASFVLCGLFFTIGLPNPRGGSAPARPPHQDREHDPRLPKAVRGPLFVLTGARSCDS